MNFGAWDIMGEVQIVDPLGGWRGEDVNVDPCIGGLEELFIFTL